jgi:CBS domain-containing protein
MSSQRDIKSVQQIVEENGSSYINLQRFMIEEPRVATSESSLYAAIQIFWAFSVRHLPVVDENTQELVGILTRENLVMFKRSQAILAKF